MSCKECEYAPRTYEEYCISRHNYSSYCCPDAYTEKSHLCGKYGEEELCDDYDVSYCEQRDCVECEYNLHI